MRLSVAKVTCRQALWPYTPSLAFIVSSLLPPPIASELIFNFFRFWLKILFRDNKQFRLEIFEWASQASSGEESPSGPLGEIADFTVEFSFPRGWLNFYLLSKCLLLRAYWGFTESFSVWNSLGMATCPPLVGHPISLRFKEVKNFSNL